MKEISLAVYYERVSTDHKEQDESMENQRALAESYLRRHPEIVLAEPLDTYSERVSGKSDVRIKYSQMLERLSKGDIRYVLIKDFKRLNRSIELSAQMKNHCKKYNYVFILLSTGQIYDPNASEQRLFYDFEAMVNEEVVHRQSEYGRLSHKQKCEAKRLTANNVTAGFKWDYTINDMVIDQPKAEIIREMFYLVLFQDYGTTELRKFLAGHGIYVSPNTIANWLKETAFIGVFHINKKGSELGVGAGQKTKRYFNPKDEWVDVLRPDLAFLDEEVFYLVQQKRQSRSKQYNPDKNGVMQARFRGSHLFSAKVYCGECGYPFVHGYADRNQSVPIYRDVFRTRARNPLEDCPNKEHHRIYEEDLKLIVTAAINNVVAEQRKYFPTLLQVLEKVLREDTSQQLLIRNKEQEIKRLEKDAEKILETFSYATGPLLADLNQKYNNLKTQINTLTLEIQDLQSKTNSELEVTQRIEAIQKVVKNWGFISPDILTRKIVDAFISKILIFKDGTIKIILNTSESPIITNLKKGNLQIGSPFLIRSTPYTKLSTIKRLILNIRTQFCGYNSFYEYIPFFSFTYQEAHSKNQRELAVCVEFELFFDSKK